VQNERTHWIDIARGIGIIFVIYAHVLGSHDFRYLFYAFHMPLFFFLSGILHKNSEGFTAFLKKSARRLLIPYFIFASLMYFLWFLNLKNHNLSHEAIKQFLSIFYGNSNNGLMAFNNILWFLPTLFVTRILFASITGVWGKTKPLIALLFFFSVFGYIFSIFMPYIKLPFGIETALSGVAFYGTGFLWQKSDNAKDFIFKYKYLLFPILLVLGSITATIDFQNYGHQIDMRLSHLNNYFLFYFGAFSGIFTWIAFSMILKKNSLLETIGKNALILFAWHPIVFIYLNKLLVVFLNLDTIDTLKKIIPLLYTIISISVILFADSIIKRLRFALQRLI